MIYIASLHDFLSVISMLLVYICAVKQKKYCLVSLRT